MFGSQICTTSEDIQEEEGGDITTHRGQIQIQIQIQIRATTTLEDIQGEEGGDINNSSRTDAADGLITTNRPQLLSSAVITFSSNTVALAQINRPALCQQSQSLPTSSEMGKKWMKHN